MGAPKALPDLLREQHERLRKVVDMAARGAAQRETDPSMPLDRVRRMLERHARHEELRLLPLLADAGPDERAIVQDLVELERAGKALEQSNPGSPEAEVVLNRVRDVLRRHQRTCEGRVLPWVEHHVAPERLVDVADCPTRQFDTEQAG